MTKKMELKTDVKLMMWQGHKQCLTSKKSLKKGGLKITKVIWLNLLYQYSHGTSMAALVMDYQSLIQAPKPCGMHSLLCAHQRSSSPLTQSMMGFRKSHFPHTGNPHASSQQTVGVMNALFWCLFCKMKSSAVLYLPHFDSIWLLIACC